MTGASWAAAAAACLQLGALGAVPAEVRPSDVQGYATGAQRVRVLMAGNARNVAEVPLEDYVAGVIASEMPASFPLEAMKAQAIAVRTYSLYHLGGHAAQGADLCDSVHCQVYHGQPQPDSRAARATAETAGQVLTYNGLLLDAMYHAACGGATATAWETKQGKLLPYLIGQPDRTGDTGRAFCAVDHTVAWNRRIPYAEANRLVRMNLNRVLHDPSVKPNRLTGLSVTRNQETGRAQWLKVRTTEGTYQVRGDAIRWLFGNGSPGANGLRSTRFTMAVNTDAKGRLRAVTFTGAGHGHGLGLCQWGARGRALAGQTAGEILEAYYPGAIISYLGG